MLYRDVLYLIIQYLDLFTLLTLNEIKFFQDLIEYQLTHHENIIIKHLYYKTEPAFTSYIISTIHCAFFENYSCIDNTKVDYYPTGSIIELYPDNVLYGIDLRDIFLDPEKKYQNQIPNTTLGKPEKLFVHHKSQECLFKKNDRWYFLEDPIFMARCPSCYGKVESNITLTEGTSLWDLVKSLNHYQQIKLFAINLI